MLGCRALFQGCDLFSLASDFSGTAARQRRRRPSRRARLHRHLFQHSLVEVASVSVIAAAICARRVPVDWSALARVAAFAAEVNSTCHRVKPEK